MVASGGPLDHVIISPSTATVSPGGNQQFTAVGEDVNNVPVGSVSYTWAVIAGGGTISSSGLFTAGNTPGTYTNTIEVIATSGAIVRSSYATVTVTPTVQSNGLFHMPPGWLRGKRKGWHGGKTPPGWAKGPRAGSHGRGKFQEEGEGQED
jgi:hypothetical protein